MLSHLVTTSLHSIAAVIWVGGMFMAYRILRPSLMQIEPPHRLTAWSGVFQRFFVWVWTAIVVLVITGYLDWLNRFGSLESMPLYLHWMQWIGWVMIGLFTWLYFVPYAHFKTHIAEQNFPAAGQTLNHRIRPIIAINLSLGMIEIVIGASGAFW